MAKKKNHSIDSYYKIFKKKKKNLESQNYGKLFLIKVIVTHTYTI